MAWGRGELVGDLIPVEERSGQGKVGVHGGDDFVQQIFGFTPAAGLMPGADNPRGKTLLRFASDVPPAS